MRFQTLFLTFSICFGIFSLSFSIPPDSPSPVKKTGCFKVNNCKCILKDGTGVISLRTMGDDDGFLWRLKPLLPANPDVLFSFSPCQPFTEPEDLAGTDCTNIAACFIVRFKTNWNNGFITRYIDYGRHEGNEFHYNDSMRILSVSYFALANNKQPQTIVHYHCNPNLTTSFIQDFSGDLPLHIWVESPCACPNACAMSDLGPGTIFLIILSLSAAAYFILGSCALRPFRTISGVQIAPEESVWCMLCYLFTERRDGRRRKRHYSLREDKL